MLDRLLGRCRFAEGDLEREDGCHGLAQRVRDEGGDLPNNRLFDLAVAPCQDGVVADRLAALGLTGEETGWTRMGWRSLLDSARRAPASSMSGCAAA